MEKDDLRVELLLGRRVRDASGAILGRIEEIRAEQEKGELWVKDYRLGPHALLERLSAYVLELPLLEFFPHRKRKAITVPWHQMDLTDPERPRIRSSACEQSRSEKRKT